MIKKLSTLPSLESVNTPLTNRPVDVIAPSSVSESDLVELSVSGLPLSQYDVGGADEGYFSNTGWASIKTTFKAFSASIYEKIVEKLFVDIDNTGNTGGKFKGSGEYLKIEQKDNDGNVISTRYIPLYEKV